jgi:hypothetical protein
MVRLGMYAFSLWYSGSISAISLRRKGIASVRDCFFVALSGHELDLLGMDAYIKRRPDLMKRAHAWIFFGSDIGAPRQPNLIHASDDALERWTVAAMEKEGLTVNGKARRDSIARGEAGAIQQGGGS